MLFSWQCLNKLIDLLVEKVFKRVINSTTIMLPISNFFNQLVICSSSSYSDKKQTRNIPLFFLVEADTMFFVDEVSCVLVLRLKFILFESRNERAD